MNPLYAYTLYKRVVPSPSPSSVHYSVLIMGWALSLLIKCLFAPL